MLTVGEFKQMLQHATGVAVKDQRITGMREGVTDRSDVEIALSEMCTIGLEVVTDADEAASREAVQRLMQEDQQQQQPPQQQIPQHFAPPQAGSSAHALVDESDGFMDDIGHHAVPDAAHPMYQPMTHLTDLLRTLVPPLVGDGNVRANPHRGSGIAVEEDAMHVDKKARVDPSLAQSFASIVDHHLSPSHEFTHALGSIRRLRKPLFVVLYDIHDRDSVNLLSILSQCNESSTDMEGLFTNFVTFMCNVREDGFGSFLDVLDNNQDLQQRLLDKLGNNPAAAALPIVAMIVPSPQAGLQVVSLMHGDISHDMLVSALVNVCYQKYTHTLNRTFGRGETPFCPFWFCNPLLSQVVSNHSERLEDEQQAHAALSANAQLREEQDTALEEAMLADAAAASARDAAQAREAREAAEAREQAAAQSRQEQEDAAREAERQQQIETRRTSRRATLEAEPVCITF